MISASLFISRIMTMTRNGIDVLMVV